MPSVAEAIEEVNDEARTWAEVIAERAAEELRRTDLTVAELIETGDPIRVLVEHGESWGADSIFVGAKGHGFLELFLLGSRLIGGSRTRLLFNRSSAPGACGRKQKAKRETMISGTNRISHQQTICGARHRASKSAPE